MSKDFNDWWNADSLVEDNPFRRESPAFWAWEGWNAGVAAEREACAALCFQIWNKWMDEKDTTSFPDAEDCAAAIRARGRG